MKNLIEKGKVFGNVQIKQFARESAILRKSYYLLLKSELLPFVVDKPKLAQIERANIALQKFVRLVEKEFDAIWYIGADVSASEAGEDEIWERFMFHHGGFMEVSLTGKIRAYFEEDKREKLIKALYYAARKLGNEASAGHIINQIKSGQKLISLQDSIELYTRDKKVRRS